MKRLSGEYIKNRELMPYDISIASSWDELTPHQAGAVISVLNNRSCTKEFRAVALICLLFGDENFKILAGLDDELLYALTPVTNFLMEITPEPMNKFPKIRAGNNLFLAPADNLSNIGFGEWCFAYQAYHGYLITHDDVWLDKLIAVLYRPRDARQKPSNADFTGDLRQKFNENLIPGREKLFSGIESTIKQAVLTWFSLALLAIMASRPNVFPTKADADELEPANENRSWFTVFREIIGPKWGTSEQLKHTNAFFVLDALEEQQIELKALKVPR